MHYYWCNRLDRSSAICTTLYRMELISLLSYAPLSKGWSSSFFFIYMPQSSWDKLDLLVLYPSLSNGWTRSPLCYIQAFISLMLYSPLFMGWTWSPYYYIFHSPRDGLDLPYAMCTTLHGMNLIFTVLYAPLSMGWSWSPGAICSTLNGMDLISSDIRTTLHWNDLIFPILYVPLSIGCI
jgi:hypothetical protein